MGSQFQPLVVPAFGGGLNFATNPWALQDDQWTFCNGFMPLDGAAEQWPTFAPLGSPIGSGGYNPIGLIPDAFLETSLLVGMENGTQLVLIQVDSTSGTPTTIARAGGTNDPKAQADDLLTTGFLNGYQVIAAGMAGVTSNRSSLIRYLGAATYDTIDPPSGEQLQPQAILSFGGHIIAAACLRSGTSIGNEGRRVAWSAANDESLWLPALSNDADDVQLDDVESRITALFKVGTQGVAVATRNNVFLLSPTGRIPAFTRQTLMPGIGCTLVRATSGLSGRRIGIYGDLPFGGAFVSSDDIILVTGSEAARISGPVNDYFFSKGKLTTIVAALLLRPIIYHGAWRQLCVPRFDHLDGECLTMELGSKAWGRIMLGDFGSSNPMRQAVIRSSTGLRWIWIDGDRQLFREDYSTGFPNAFVDTKDFTFQGEQAYLDEILVEWEPLVSPTTTIQISSASRDDLNVGFGTLGRDISPSFTVQGSLTNGASRLGLRNVTRGRFHRLRFQTTTGRARIRGFKLFRKAAGRRP